MAIILVLLGGMLGFASALASVVLFNGTMLHALALWSGTGTAFVAAALLLSFLPRRLMARDAAPRALGQNA